MAKISPELKKQLHAIAQKQAEKIAKELGMDPDEVLRLKQITGLADLFDKEYFSKSWEPENGFNKYSKFRQKKG